MSDKEKSNTSSYYDEKFDRLSQRTRKALNNIQLECEHVEELLTVYEHNNNHSRKE